MIARIVVFGQTRDLTGKAGKKYLCGTFHWDYSEISVLGKNREPDCHPLIKDNLEIHGKKKWRDSTKNS